MRVATMPLASITRRLSSFRQNSLRTMQLGVSPPLFVGLWWSVLSIHLVSGTFLIAVGLVHLFVARDNVHRNLWLLRIAQPTLQTAGWSYLLVAVPHFVAICKDISRSVAHRRLTFSTSSSTNRRTATATIAASSVSPSRWRLARLKDAFVARWRRYFDANGDRFDVGFCARQSLEIAAQTYQAYLFSWATPAVHLNRVLVSLIMLNCVYPRILAALFKLTPAAHRAVVVGVDLVIDLSVSVAIPVWILAPPLIQFDWTNRRFADELRFDEVWFAKTLSESRQIMVTSSLDYVSSLVPYIAAMESLGTLKRVLLRLKHETKMIVPPEQEKTSSLRPASGVTAVNSPRSLLLRVFDYVAMLWALTVLGVQLQAELRSSNTPTTICELPMKPWFAHNMSCAVVGVNCHRHGIHGLPTELTSLLNQVDRSALMKLHFSHCTELHMPEIMAEFSQIMGIQTINCSIADWPRSAALTQRRNPKMGEVQLFATNLSAFPAGLLHGELPTRLSLLLHRSNLTRLPEDCGDTWAQHTWPYFSMEHVPLEKLPASFGHAAMMTLTLYDTRLDHIPSDMFANQRFTRLRLSHNRRLQEIPRDIGSTADLTVVVAEHTNISQVPPWFESWMAAKRQVNGSVSFYGSPLCSNSNTASTSSSTSSSSIDGLCSSVRSVETADHRFEVVRGMRPP